MNNQPELISGRLEDFNVKQIKRRKTQNYVTINYKKEELNGNVKR